MLKNAHVVARYGFLYSAYRPDAYRWDVFELLRKLFLTGVVMLISPGTSFQIIVAVLFNLMFAFLILIETPHLPGPGRTLATLTYIAITLTMLLGLMLKTVEAASDCKIVFDISLLTINISVVVYTLKVLVGPLCQAMKERRQKKVTMNHPLTKSKLCKCCGRRKKTDKPRWFLLSSTRTAPRKKVRKHAKQAKRWWWICTARTIRKRFCDKIIVCKPLWFLLFVPNINM